MAAIKSPRANPTANERPARSRYRAAESVALVVRNKNRKRSGPGRLVTRTVIHGATLSSWANVASLFESFAIELTGKILADEVPSGQYDRLLACRGSPVILRVGLRRNDRLTACPTNSG